MAANAFTLRILIQVPPSNAPAEARRVNKSLVSIEKTAGKTAKKVTGNFKALAGAFTTLVVAKRVLDAIKGLVAPAIAFEDALNKVKVTTNVTTEELELLKRKTLEVAEATAFSPEEAIEGMRALRKATANTAATMNSLKEVLAFAAIAEIEAGDAANVAGDMLSTFADVDATNIGDKLSELVAVSKVLRADFKDVLPVMARLGTSGRKVSASFRDMVIAFQLARSSGEASTRVMTSLDRFVTEMGDEKKRLALQKLFGKGVFRDGADNIRPLPIILADLSKAIDGTAFEASALGSKLSKVLGHRAARVVFMAVSQMKKEIAGLPPGMREGEDAIKALYATMEAAPSVLDALEERNKTVAVSLDRLEQSANILLITIGTPLLQPLAAVTNGIRELITAADQWLNSNSETASSVVSVISTLVGLFALVAGGIFVVAAAKAAIVLLGIAIDFSGISALFSAKSFAFLTSWIGKDSLMATAAAVAKINLAESQWFVNASTWALVASTSANTATQWLGVVAGKALAFVMWGLGAAIRFAIPAVGILLVVAAALGVSFFSGSDAATDLNGNLETMANKTVPALTESFAEATLEVTDTLDEFKKFIKATSKVLSFDRPKIDFRPIDKTLAVVKKLGKEGKITGATVEAMTARINNAARIFDKAAKGGSLTTAEFKELNDVARSSGVFLEREARGMKGLRKEVDKFGEASVAATSEEAKLNAEEARRLGLTEERLFVTRRAEGKHVGGLIGSGAVKIAPAGVDADVIPSIGVAPTTVFGATGIVPTLVGGAGAAAKGPTPAIPNSEFNKESLTLTVDVRVTPAVIESTVDAVITDRLGRAVASGTTAPSFGLE